MAYVNINTAFLIYENVTDMIFWTQIFWYSEINFESTDGQFKANVIKEEMLTSGDWEVNGKQV